AMVSSRSWAEREPFTESKGLTAMVNPETLPHKPAVSGPRQQAWIRALDRTRLVAIRKPTYCCGRDHFKVYSERAGNTYIVCPVLDDGGLTYHCDCQAGLPSGILRAARSPRTRSPSC
ncbi:MAG TPA: hypothetical protein VHB98_23440, partial [Chloroflexota bacterium]|nr:hypothetical protein [Chloroflexota bacterium]